MRDQRFSTKTEPILRQVDVKNQSEAQEKAVVCRLRHLAILGTGVSFERQEYLEVRRNLTNPRSLFTELWAYSQSQVNAMRGFWPFPLT